MSKVSVEMARVIEIVRLANLSGPNRGLIRTNPKRSQAGDVELGLGADREEMFSFLKSCSGKYWDFVVGLGRNEHLYRVKPFLKGVDADFLSVRENGEPLTNKHISMDE